MKTKVETVLNLSKDLRAKEVAKLKPEELEKFAEELKRAAIAKQLNIQGIVIEAAKIRTMVAAGLESNDELSAEQKAIDTEAAVNARLKRSINQLLTLFPEMVIEQKLALDREFEDQRDRLNAIIDDLNKSRLPKSRFHELVHENLYSNEDGVIESRTFLAYALKNDKLTSLSGFLEALKDQLSGEEFNLYINTPNSLPNSERKVSVSELFLEDFGHLNEMERKAISKDNKGILQTYSPKKEPGRRVVDINQINTHNVSSHKSGDEAHVSAFKMMVEANNLNVTANYTKPVKTSDPSREVKITNKGNLDGFVASKLGELKKDVDNLLKMSDGELYDNYVRHNDIEKFKRIEYKDIEEADKAGIDKKIKGLRFKAGAAKRYMDNMLKDHKCNSGTYEYKTNDAASCGLNMEQMVATSYWASKDKANFKSPNVSEKGNFLSLIDQLYDMRRGYDIDHGTDRPDELLFPATPSRDNNRCHGGGVNSLSWALATAHKAYNPVKIERSDIENALTDTYSLIVKENIEYIKTIATPNELMAWSSTKKITGDLKKNLEKIFNSKYQEGFVGYYKGYIPDDTFYSVMDKGLDNITIPESLKTQYAIEVMDGEAIYKAIANGKLPLIHFDKTRGYESTLNYLSSLPGKKTLIEGVAVWAIANQHEPSASNVLTYLSRSKLSDEYKNMEVISIKGKPFTFGDIASLQPKELRVLCTCKTEDIVETCIQQDNKNLFNLYALKVGFTNAELSKKYGYLELTPLYFAVKSGDVEVVKAILATPDIDKQALLEAKERNSYTPLHSAVEEGNIEIVKAILATEGINKQALLEGNDFYGNTPLHFAVMKGHVKVVEAILATTSIDIKTLLKEKNNNHSIPLHFAAMKGHVEVVKAILATPGINKQALLEDKNWDGDTPLNLALKKGKVEVVKEILETEGINKQALLEDKNWDGDTPLHFAVKTGNVEVVKEILETEGINKQALLEDKNRDGDTPLHFAVKTGNVEVVKAILATEGINKQAILEDKNWGGDTPLNLALKKGKVEVVKAILATTGIDKQAFLEAKNNIGDTPLHFAVKTGNVEVVKAILATEGINKQALLENKNRDGDTPLHFAVKTGNVEVVKAILATEGINKQALLENKNRDGDTPLHYAAFRGSVEVVKAILATPGIDIQKLLEAKDDNGGTPLYVAITLDKVEVVKAILATEGINKQALLDDKNKDGDTPLHYAAFRGGVEVVKAILATPGIDIQKLLEAKNRCGHTPLGYAVNKGYVEVVKILKEAEAGLLSNLLSSLMSALTNNPLETTSLSRPANLQNLKFSSILWETCVEFSHTISMNAAFENSNKINRTDNIIVR